MLLCLGCTDNRLKTYPVQGKVVFPDGSPVRVGTIETKSILHGVQASGSIATDGTFQLTTYQTNDGAVAGDHRCVIVQFIPVEEIPNYRPSTLGVVNRKYSSYATSELVFTVEAKGDNQIWFEVQGADPVFRATDEHGHDPLPAEPSEQNPGPAK